MFKDIVKFFKKFGKNEKESSKTAAKERLHLVLAQDRANISADFLEMMKQEIIEVIKKYVDIDEEAIDVRMTNKTGEDGTVGAPALYANIPIITIKNEARKMEGTANANKEDSTNSSANENEKKDKVIKQDNQENVPEKDNTVEEVETNQENDNQNENKNDNDIEEDKKQESKNI